MGIGPVGFLQRASNINHNLVPVNFGQNREESYMWFVYHKDMRSSGRVQALQGFIRQHLPGMLPGGQQTS